MSQAAAAGDMATVATGLQELDASSSCSRTASLYVMKPMSASCRRSRRCVDALHCVRPWATRLPHAASMPRVGLGFGHDHQGIYQICPYMLTMCADQRNPSSIYLHRCFGGAGGMRACVRVRSSAELQNSLPPSAFTVCWHRRLETMCLHLPSHRRRSRERGPAALGPPRQGARQQ